MNTLGSVTPELVSEISRALLSSSRPDLASQLDSATIERCTYDPAAEAGYIYLVRPKVSWYFATLATPVAETIPFMESGFNIDVDHDGQLFGIEFLNREDFLTQLRKANAL